MPLRRPPRHVYSRAQLEATAPVVEREERRLEGAQGAHPLSQSPGYAWRACAQGAVRRASPDPMAKTQPHCRLHECIHGGSALQERAAHVRPHSTCCSHHQAARPLHAAACADYLPAQNHGHAWRLAAGEASGRALPGRPARVQPCHHRLACSHGA
eukprot:scaffold222513_cov31-Tisochrysis_lutea.AAC.2